MGGGSYKWIRAAPGALERVFLTSPLHDAVQGRLASEFDLRVHRGPRPIPREGMLAGVREAAGLVCFPFDTVDAGVIGAAPGLRAVSTYSVGYDHIDVGLCRGRGIAVGYTPDVLTDATADLAVALMLDVMRRVSEGDRMVRGGRWRGALGAHEYVGRDLRGKTLGIVGMGRIGRAVASRAAAFGMRVVYHSRGPADCPAERVGLGELLSRSDVVSLHVPHTPETDGMIDAAALARMRPGAFLVNTSRGAVVDERDLADALGSGRIAGAGLDVFRSEPVGASHPLAGLPNAVLTPHIGSSTAETRLAMAEMAADNLRDGMAGRRPRYPVPG